MLRFAGQGCADAADLGSSALLLATDDTLDVDGDRVDDFVVTSLRALQLEGPILDLAEDGRIHVPVTLRPVAGGPSEEAIIRLGTAPEPPLLHRATVTDVSAGWQARVGLPLGPGSNNDPGWPMGFAIPGMFDDAGVVGTGDPLVLYRVLSAAGTPVGEGLRVATGAPDAVTLTWQ